MFRVPKNLSCRRKFIFTWSCLLALSPFSLHLPCFKESFFKLRTCKTLFFYSLKQRELSKRDRDLCLGVKILEYMFLRTYPHKSRYQVFVFQSCIYCYYFFSCCLLFFYFIVIISDLCNSRRFFALLGATEKLEEMSLRTL